MNKLNMDHWKTGSAREAQIERDYDAEQYFNSKEVRMMLAYLIAFTKVSRKHIAGRLGISVSRLYQIAKERPSASTAGSIKNLLCIPASVMGREGAIRGRTQPKQRLD